MPKQQLNAIASALRTVHKHLLEYEKRIYEKTYGRVENPYQLLHMAMEDPQFAWLRAMSGEMVHLDEVRLNRDGVTDSDLRLIGTRLRALLIQDRAQTPFQQRYEEAKAAQPEILLAHRDLISTLPAAPAVELYLSAGNEHDDKDPVPSAIRPGALIPGFADKGYYALGAIEERGALANVPVKLMHYSNETVFDIASVGTRWAVDDETFETRAWEPVIIRAGTGSRAARTYLGDGVQVSLYVRQQELGGDPMVLTPEGHQIDGWTRAATADDLGNAIEVNALIAPPGVEMHVPVEEGSDALLYVVAGAIEIDGVAVPDSRLALVRNPVKLMIRTTADTMLLALSVAIEATVVRAGSLAR